MKSIYSELSTEENEILEKDPDVLFRIFLEVLNKHALCNKIYIRGNNKTFMTKELSEALMQRSSLLTEIK